MKLTLKKLDMEKISVTCECGKSVSVPLKMAAQVMATGRTYDHEHLKRISKQGVEARKRKKI